MKQSEINSLKFGDKIIIDNKRIVVFTGFDDDRWAMCIRPGKDCYYTSNVQTPEEMLSDSRQLYKKQKPSKHVHIQKWIEPDDLEKILNNRRISLPGLWNTQEVPRMVPIIITIRKGDIK